ncbi:MAG: DUF1990 domain-containing protein [Sandaracinaceae bacterium]|nr:DUF1990 domain-containing protein [Sandaracinaceae bacterium]
MTCSSVRALRLPTSTTTRPPLRVSCALPASSRRAPCSRPSRDTWASPRCTCRVIYVAREPSSFAFGFGTLPGHAESGEESFRVTLDDDVVRYDVQAFSRPHGVLSRLGAPVARSYQLRFQRETLEWMRALVR